MDPHLWIQGSMDPQIHGPLDPWNHGVDSWSMSMHGHGREHENEHERGQGHEHGLWAEAWASARAQAWAQAWGRHWHEHEYAYEHRSGHEHGNGRERKIFRPSTGCVHGTKSRTGNGFKQETGRCGSPGAAHTLEKRAHASRKPFRGLSGPPGPAFH